MKKFLIVIIILALLSGIGYIVWTYFSPEKPDSTGNGVGPKPPALPPPSGPSLAAPTLSAVSKAQVFDYWTTASGEIYFFSPDGQIFKITSLGNEENISSAKIIGLNSVRAVSGGKMAVASFGSPNRLSFSVLNLDDRSWLPLPEGTVSAAWHPNKNQLVYLKENINSSTLNLIDFDANPPAGGKKPRITEILKLNQKDIELEWLLPDEIYLKQRPSAKISGSLWALNIKTKNLRVLAAEELGLMISWSADGKTGLKFSNNRLDLIDQNGKILRQANIPVTLPSKCLISGTTTYCAVPQNISASTLLPDDYLQRKFYSEDSIISWDTGKNIAQILFTGVENRLDAHKLKKLGQKLYFANRYDQKIYSLKIGE